MSTFTGRRLTSRHEVAPKRPDRLLVVTPWYPNETNVFRGTFVRESTRSVGRFFSEVTILHLENVAENDDRSPQWTDTPEGRLLWVPVPTSPTTSRGQMILRQREAAMGAAHDVLRDADVVHCHVGAPTGAAIAPLLPSVARLVVTEHASYLPRVFRDPLGAELYGLLRQRADAFTAVSAQTASLIDTAIPVPAHRQPVSVIANPVDMRRLPLRAERTARIARWLFVGNLVEAKGVRRLVRSFARWASAHADRPCALTLPATVPCAANSPSWPQSWASAIGCTFSGGSSRMRSGRCIGVTTSSSTSRTVRRSGSPAGGRGQWALRRRHHVRGAGEHPPRPPRRRLGCLRARGRRGRRGVGV